MVIWSWHHWRGTVHAGKLPPAVICSGSVHCCSGGSGGVAGGDGGDGGGGDGGGGLGVCGSQTQ